MAEHRRAAVSRRPLVTGVVAGAVLCGVWLLPSAHAGHEDGQKSSPAPADSDAGADAGGSSRGPLE